MAWMGLSREHEDEIAARGLDVSLAEKLGVWSDGRAIAFDYHRADGRVHNTKLRRGKGDMPWATQGLPLIPWNVTALAGEAGDRALIWAEGEFDGWAMVQAGFLDVTSVPNGAPSSENEQGNKRYAYLYRGEKLHPDIDKFRTHILAGDGDEKGIFLRDALAARLGVERCLYVTWPEGCKDANDTIREHGVRAVVECVNGARRMFADEVACLHDIPEPPPVRVFSLGFEELHRIEFKGSREEGNLELIFHTKKDENGKPTDPLKNHLKFPDRGIVTILGPYGHGKSTFIRHIIKNMNELHGWKTAITSFEEQAKPEVRDAFRRTYLGKPLHMMRPHEIEVADDWIHDNIVFISKIMRRPTDAIRLLELVEYTIKAYGVNMVVIDPFNAIDHSWNRKGKTKTEYIGDFLMELYDITYGYGCLGVVSVHPPTETMKQKKKSGEPYYAFDAADSAMFGNKSNICLCCWQPGKDDYFLVNPDKIKNKALIGTPIGMEFKFDSQSDRFYVSRLGWNVLEREDDQ